MKIITLIVLLSFYNKLAYSQITFGAQAMVNVANANYEAGAMTNKLSTSGKTKFGFGLLAEVNISRSFTLRPGLTYIGKGIIATFQHYGRTYDYIRDLDFNVIEFPVVFCYNAHFKSAKLFVGIGESLGFGIKGRERYTHTIANPGAAGTTVTDSYNAYAFAPPEHNFGSFKSVEISATGIAGLQFNNGIFADISYLKGLNNLSALHYSNRGFQLGMGYLFHYRK